MPDPFEKVKPGDSIQIHSTVWNSMLDVVRPNRDTGNGVNKLTSTRGTIILRIKNESGDDLPRGAILGLDGPTFTPTDSEDAFMREPSFSGIVPDIALHKRRYCVLLDPAADGSFARAFLAGVCQVRVDVIDPAHEFARIEDGETGFLTSSRYGHAQILWREGDEGYGYGYETGEQWALVRLGVTMSCFSVGKVNGSVTARVGSVLGTGQVDLYRSDDGAVDGPIETVDVLNVDTLIGDDVWVSVAWDADGNAWVAPLQCVS